MSGKWKTLPNRDHVTGVLKMVLNEESAVCYMIDIQHNDDNWEVYLEILR
jgi:hypothetical protein